MSSATFGDFEERVRASFARQPAMQTLGITLDEVAPGAVDLALGFDPRLTQQHGFIHAGILATALDTAAGLAALSLMPEEAGVLTIEFKTSLMRPARARAFRFAGRVLRFGRNIVFTEAQALGEGMGEGMGDGREIARLSATMMVVQGRDDVKG